MSKYLKLYCILFCLPIMILGQNIPDGFVEIRSVIPDIHLDLRYAGNHNFIGRPIAGYKANKCYISKRAAVALKNVQDELRPFGFSLKIYDAYRPQKAVDDFVRWARVLSDTLMKTEFYPAVEKKHLFRDGYIASKSSHSRGSTVDITIIPIDGKLPATFTAGDTLCDCRAPANKRFHDNSIDMGTGYDCFSPYSWTSSEKIGPQQRANRLLLKTLMEKHGFRNYSKEWWHYTLRNEPFPDIRFNFDVK